MPTGNPLDQLRRRKQSQATPAAFAALAEEHRRAGRLAEAIAVCRDGLERYPTYVSARVTLGRALLDSGDAVTAVTELEQAVAQAPDNLAAARALDAARAACADVPDLAPPPPLDDLTLHRAAVPEADPLTPVGDFPSEGDVALPPLPDVSFGSLTGGSDAPQEFGLRDDWTLPELPTDAPPSLSPWDAPAESIDAPFDHAESPLAIGGHADAPTTYLTPPSLQGEEPAGIWPVALTPEAERAAVDAEPQFAWVPGAPGEAGDFVAVSPADASDGAAQGMWHDTTIVVSRGMVEANAPAAPVGESAAPWTGLFEEPVGEGAEPAAFAGWDAPGPSAPGKPAWGSDEQGAQDADEPSRAASSMNEPILAPGGSTFTWGEPVADEWLDPSVTAPPPEEDAIDAVHVDEVASARLDEDASESMWVDAEAIPAAGEPMPVEAVPLDVAPLDASPLEAAPLDAMAADRQKAVDESHRQSVSTWAGSVASALDEVFRQAGQPQGALPVAEPPPPADDPHRATMADTAVEAALEDALGTPTRGDDASVPALVSLQQMLDAVRARRAALFTESKH